MRRHCRRDIGAVLIAVAALLTACSSGSSSPTTATTQGTKSPIKIGTIGAFSGGTGVDGAAELTMMKGWAQSVNDAGGINGHPIDLIADDDGPNASTGLDDVKQMVQDDHIVALVGNFDPSDSNWMPYMKTTGVPVIGGVFLPTFPAAFPGGTNSIAAVYGSLLIAKQAGPNFGTLYCAEYTACAKATSLYATVANAIGGIQVKVAAKVSATAPDYTGPCQQLINAHVNSIQIGAPAAVAQRVTDTCHSLGLKATTVQIDDTLSPAWLTDPAFNGMRAAEYDAPFFLGKTAGQKEYRAALKKYIPSLGNSDSPAPQYAWIAGKLFEKAAQAVGSGAVTPASITKAMYTLHNETLGGLTPPLSYTKGQTPEINCYFVIGIDNGKWVAPQGNKTSCAPDDFVAPIFKAFS